MLFVAMHYGEQGMPACPACLLQRAKMQRVSEVLQLPIIIERRRPLALEPQPLEEVDFLLRRIAAEGRVLEEGLKPRLLVARVFGALSRNSNFFRCSGTKRRFKTISIPNVARSMSQDSSSGSKKATQCSPTR